jgi:hypothetical protein
MALREGTRWRSYADLRLVCQIAGFGRKVLVKCKGYGLGSGGQQSGAATRDQRNTQNSPKRAATIGYIHGSLPYFGAFFFSNPRVAAKVAPPFGSIQRAIKRGHRFQLAKTYCSVYTFAMKRQVI